MTFGFHHFLEWHRDFYCSGIAPARAFGRNSGTGVTRLGFNHCKPFDCLEVAVAAGGIGSHGNTANRFPAFP